MDCFFAVENLEYTLFRRRLPQEAHFLRQKFHASTFSIKAVTFPQRRHSYSYIGIQLNPKPQIPNPKP